MPEKGGDCWGHPDDWSDEEWDRYNRRRKRRALLKENVFTLKPHIFWLQVLPLIGIASLIGYLVGELL